MSFDLGSSQRQIPLGRGPYFSEFPSAPHQTLSQLRNEVELVFSSPASRRLCSRSDEYFPTEDTRHLRGSIHQPHMGVYRRVAMKTLLRNFTCSKNCQVQKGERSRATREALLRLAANSRDACALVTVYDEHGTDLKSTAIRWFGGDAEVRSRAINSILAAIGRQAGSYDPQSMDAAQWVRNCADTEARRLREALDAGNSRGRGTRRAI